MSKRAIKAVDRVVDGSVKAVVNVIDAFIAPAPKGETYTVTTDGKSQDVTIEKK